LIKSSTMRKIVFFVLALSLSLAQETKRYYLTVEGKAPRASFLPTTAVVTVLTAEDIKKMPFTTLAEILQFLPSLTVVRRSQASFDLSVRGASPKRTLILLNGMRINDPQSEHFNMEVPISLQQIERIEIFKGGTSTFYGSSSAAGGINIVTSSGGNTLSAVAGEKGLFGFAASASLGNFSLGLSSRKSRGYYPGREFDLRDVSAQYTGKKARLFFGAGVKEMGEANFYAPYPSWERIGRYVLSGNLRLGGVELGLLSRTLRDHFVLDRERPLWYENRHKNFLHSLRAAKRFSLPRGEITLGLEGNSEGIRSGRLGNHHRESLALVGEFTRAGGGFSLDLGLRAEVFSAGKPFYGFYLGYQKSLGKAFLISASVGNSFRLPSFTELYYSSPANVGNPDLRPEKSLSADLSLETRTVAGRGTVSLFWRRDRDLVDWVRTGIHSPWRAANLAPIQRFGLEFSWGWRWRRGIFSLGFLRTFLHYRMEETPKYALALDKLKLSSSLIFYLGRIGFSSALSYREMVLGQKGIFLNARISLRLPGKIRVFLQGSNLFNTVIEEIPGVKIEGRWLSAGLRLDL